MKNLIIIAVAILLLLSGCKAIREARDAHKEERVEKWLLLHPEKFAQKCSDEFPCTGDSTTSTEYSPAGNTDYAAQIDSLSKLIWAMDSTWFLILDSATTETAEAYLQRIRELQGHVTDLQVAITRLQVSYKPCKPDTLKTSTHVVTIDSAAYTAKRLEALRLQKELAAMILDRDDKLRQVHEWRSKARSRTWMFIAACALSLGLIAVIIAILKGKGKVKKITNPIDGILSP